MILTLPKIGSVRFRDDLTDEQFKSQLEALSKKYDFEIPQAELTTGEMAGRAFERGKKRLSSTFGDLLPGMIASGLGFDEYAKQQMEEAGATEEEIQTYYAPQYKSYKDIEGVGSALGFGLETVVEQIPNILTSLIPGVGAGAVAGRTALAATAKTLTAQAAQRGLAGQAAEEFVTQGLKAAAPAIASRVGAAQGAGVFLGSYAQNAPEIFNNIYQETGTFAPGTALLFGSVSAALDSILPATLARQLTGPTRIGVVEKLLERSGMDRGVLRSTTAGIFKGVGTEGLTEGAQEAISITAERFIDENPDVFGSKEFERLIEASVRGAVAGSAFGGAGGSIESLRASAERKRKLAEIKEQRGERDAATRLRKEIEGIESEIKQLELVNPQQTLPGMDTEVSSGFSPEALRKMEEERLKLTNPQVLAAKAAVDAKNSLTGKQLSLFDEEGKLTKAAEKAATKDQKKAANAARQEAQRAATELKADQDRLKKYLTAKQATIPGFSEGEVQAFQTQVKEQRAAQAEAGQGDLFTGMPPPPEPEVTPEPVAPTTLIGSDKEGLKTFGKQFGIGPTARILREDGPLAGKDISKPEDAAEVKRVLEAYASAKPATGAAAKIEEYLQRPEFQVIEEAPAPTAITKKGVWKSKDFDFPVDVIDEAPVNRDGVLYSKVIYQGNETFVPTNQLEVTTSGEPTTEFIAGTSEPSVGAVVQREPSEGVTEGVGEPAVGDVVSSEPAPAIVDERETVVEPTLEPTVEPTVEEVVTETEAAPLDVVKEADDRATEFIRRTVTDAFEEVGLAPTNVSLEDFKDTDAYNYIRLPQIANEFFRLKDVLATPDEQLTKKDRAKLKQDQADLKRLEKIVKDIGGVEFFNALNSVPLGKREAIFSEMKREARAQLVETVQSDTDFQQRMQKREKAAEVRPGQTTFARKPKKGKKTQADKDIEEFSQSGLEVTDEELDAFNQAYFEKTGETLFLSKHRGPDFDDNLRSLVEAGNLRGAIDSLAASTTNKDVRRILNKIKGLNLKTKIVIGAVEGNRPASYDSRTNTITLSPEAGMNEHALLHEVMHAAVSHVLRNESLPVSKELIGFFNQIQNQVGNAYGGQDIQEFTAELFSNPEFQALLKTIKAPKSESLFKRIMQTLAQFFGFGKGTDAYTRGMQLINDAVDISGDVEPSISDSLFLGTPNGMRRGLNGVGAMGQAMPSLAGEAIEGTRNYLSNMPGDVRSIAMGLLRLDNINDIYGKDLPSLQKLIDALELRNGTQEQRIKVINDNYVRFNKAARKNPKAMERMNDMAYDARLGQVDPIDPNFKPSAGQVAEYNRIKQIYNSLPADIQQVYKDIRKSYADAINEYEDILVNSIEDPSIRRKLKAQYEARKRQIAYIPFLRQGDFWVEYDENGQRAAQAFQSERERQTFISTQLKNKPHKAYRNLDEAVFTQGSLPPGSFIAQVMTQLNNQGANEQLKNNVYQSYLALFPAESLAKNFMKADNVRGMERDIVRGYGETMIKWARKLSASKYNPEIDRALGEIRQQGKKASENPNKQGAFTAAENVLSQSSFFHNPTYGKLISAATTFSYFNYIAGNISSALVNLSTIPMFSWSILGARYGFDKSSSALFNSSKVTMNYIFNKKIPAKYNKLFEELSNHAQLEHTLAREVLEGRRERTQDFTGLKARVIDGLSIPFNNTEILNRGATAVAAYDLARSGNLAMGIKPMNEADAIRYAINTTKQINTSGLSATAPRYMQHPAGRIFFTFKTFIWNSAYVVARAFHQAFKGETPAVQREARRQLLGIYGMTMAFAGINGLPFMGVLTTLSTMIEAMFGDDDEPWDLEVEMRSFFGDLLYKGGVNYVTNLEVSNRVGVANDLIFRDDPRSVAEHGYVLTAMSQAFGPLGSFALGVGRGSELVAQGEIARGLESMVPSFVRNGMKAMRFAEEGALNLKGEPIVEDISAYNTLMQVVGFSPADLSNVYEEISLKKEFERDVLQRRARLLNKFYMARKAGDTDLEEEVRAEIDAFNEDREDPKARIKPDTLRRSEAARKAYEDNTINGVRFNKSLMSEIDDLMEE
jgi:hypothetical protein